MRRFLLTAGLDGRMGTLAKLQTLVRERKPQGVLFAGGILGRPSNSPSENWKTWESFFGGLGKLGVFTAMIPGLADAPLRQFLRRAAVAEVDHPNVHVAHATLFEEGDVAFCGLGGELTEGEDWTEDRLCYARSSAEYFLRALPWAEQPHKVLLLSVPPTGPLGGEAGNGICGDFIDSFHPSLCLVAGTTERRGMQRIAHTLVVNPGRLADESAAWLDWDRPQEERVELFYL